jgi:hypothetical protein
MMSQRQKIGCLMSYAVAVQDIQNLMALETARISMMYRTVVHDALGPPDHTHSAKTLWSCAPQFMRSPLPGVFIWDLIRFAKSEVL